MTFPARFLDEIRSRITLSEMIGRRIRVIRAGREFKACCPFHHEKTPSFTINDDKQFFHCFGCGAHGDVIGFVMRHDNLSFPETIEILAAEAGLQVPQQSPQEVKKAQEQKDLYALMEAAVRFYEAQLQKPQNRDALDYLRQRGLKEETIAGFRLGFAPEDGQALRRHLTEQGFKDADMKIAGVLKDSSKGGAPYDFFRDRVMFPVPDRRGRVVAFGGRVLPAHLRPPRADGFTPPKYINSTETPLFHKGGMLYGEPHARRAAADGRPLIVVEGYLDVIACAQDGFKGALAPMGTALTEAQIVALWRMIPGEVKVPILCFDGDGAGRKAATRAAEVILPFLKPGCSVNFAFLPEGEDPDSLIKTQGPQAFEAFLAGAVPLHDFMWSSFTGGRVLKTPEARAGVVQALEQQIAKIDDKTVQTHYRAMMREYISARFFPKTQRPEPARRGGGYGSQRGVPAPSGFALPRPAAQGARLAPRILLAAVLNHPHIYGGIEEAFGSLEVDSPDLAALRSKIVQLLSDNPALSREALIENLKNFGLDQVIDDILKESVYVHASFCAPSANSDVVEGLWLAYWKDTHDQGLWREIQSGWRRAYDADSAEEEERLKAMVAIRASESLV